jgi:hypothetical protein
LMPALDCIPLLAHLVSEPRKNFILLIENMADVPSKAVSSSHK